MKLNPLPMKTDDERAGSSTMLPTSPVLSGSRPRGMGRVPAGLSRFASKRLCVLCKREEPPPFTTFQLILKCFSCGDVYHTHCLGMLTLEGLPADQVIGNKSYQCCLCEHLNLDGWKYIPSAPDHELEGESVDNFSHLLEEVNASS